MGVFRLYKAATKWFATCGQLECFEATGMRTTRFQGAPKILACSLPTESNEVESKHCNWSWSTIAGLEIGRIGCG